MRSRLASGFWSRPEVQALVSSDIPPRIVVEKLKKLFPSEAARLTTGRISRERWLSKQNGTRPSRRGPEEPWTLPVELRDPVTETDKDNLILKTTRRMYQLEDREKVLQEQLATAESRIGQLSEELAESRRLLEVLRGKHTDESLAVAGGNIRGD